MKLEISKKIHYEELCERLVESGIIKVNKCGNFLILADNGMRKEVINSHDNCERAIRDLFTAASQKYIDSRVIRELIRMIPLVSSNYVLGKCSDTGKIIFLNGIYDIESACITNDYNDIDTYWATVDAKYISGISIDDAPVFKKFLCTSLDYDTDEGKLKSQLLLEIIGYCLSDFTTAKKAFFCIGKPDSGKSQILEFIKKLLPANETTQIPFCDLGGQFASSGLRNSRINLSSEMDERLFPRADYIKRLTSNDSATVAVKHKESISFKSRTRFISACNSMPLPKLSDGTDSILNRMCFLVFENSIDRSEQDMELVHKLLRERDVICSLAVDTLKDLQSRNFDFTMPESSIRYRELYKTELNPAELFFKECCVMKEEEYIKPMDLYSKYNTFCKNNGYRNNMLRNTFFNTFESRFPNVIKKRTRAKDDKNPTNYYVGIVVSV